LTAIRTCPLLWHSIFRSIVDLFQKTAAPAMMRPSMKVKFIPC
jgi:hypothetical protein